MIDNKPSSKGAPHELVSLYALGALDSDDNRQFEEHLRQGCPACEMELRSFGRVAASLGGSVLAGPPASLRARLLAKVSGAPRVPGVLLEQGGLLISRSDEVAWQALAPGIQFKPLHVDVVRKYNTCLVRMDAGARYPSHRHRELEELFMLSGELHVEGQIMRGGDYCRADSDTIHGETFTDSGCLFLLLASQQNEVLA